MLSAELERLQKQRDAGTLWKYPLSIPFFDPDAV